MGRRSAAACFMPGVYVFPGGSLELSDNRPSGFGEVFDPAPPGVDTATARKLPALIRGALRELQEETGLFLADRPTARGRPWPSTAIWRTYVRSGFRPAFGAPRLIVRAITPPAWPTRFDTRFFCAPGDLARGRISGDGELEDVAWMPFSRLEGLKMAPITRWVMSEALSFWQGRSGSRRPPSKRHRARTLA